MHHHDAQELVGHCPCGCHGGPAEPAASCWCRNHAGDPLALSHNDRVRVFGVCHLCRARCCDDRSTSPELAHAVRRVEDARREQRIRRGRPTASDLAYMARHPGRYGLWR